MILGENEYVGKALDFMKEGLIPFVEERLESNLKGYWEVEIARHFPKHKKLVKDGKINWDTLELLRVLQFRRREAFRDLKRPIFKLVGETCVARNKWAHQGKFTSIEASRALEVMQLLLETIGKENDPAFEYSRKIKALHQELTRETKEAIESSGPPRWQTYFPVKWLNESSKEKM